MSGKEVFIMVAYDISSDRRRNKLVKVIKDYGVRVNYSVFECLVSKTEISELKSRVKDVIKPGKDCVLYYELCRNCLVKRDFTGSCQPPMEWPGLVKA